MAELCIFARAHSVPGREAELEAAIRDVLASARTEPGCLKANLFRSHRDAGEFFVHSRWRDEAAYESHRTEPHTAVFRERIAPLVDQPLDLARTTEIG
jgi:quinol monooxygenase YgiN